MAESRPTRPSDVTAEAIGALMRTQGGQVDRRHDAAERDRLIARVSAPPPARRGARWDWLYWPSGARAVAVAAVLGVALALALAWPRERLAYEVTGGSLDAGGYLHAASGDVTLSFAGGTTMRLSRGSHGRLAEVTRRGARLQLEAGRVDARVERSGGVWSVAAGPYLVSVKGTRFQVSWRPEPRAFTVTVTEGVVSVRGPLLQDGLAVHAGERLEADLARGKVLVSDGQAAPPASGAASEGQPPEELATTPAVLGSATASVEAAPKPPPAPRKSWGKLVAEGEFDRVLQEADARGVDGVIGGGTLPELVALADAARYRGRTAIARRALSAVRERHPASAAAASAAFLLGGMSTGSVAIGWYDLYLSEAPGGPFAAEALGRKMVLLRGSGRLGEARAVARRYLDRYPKGGYAPVARDLSR